VPRRALNNTNVPFEMYKKCNIPIEYSGTTGAITEIRSNNIFLLASSDGQADDLVTMVGNCRVRFSDGFVTPRMFRNPPGGEEQSAPTVGPKNEIF